jgi:cell division protein FtsQ
MQRPTPLPAAPVSGPPSPATPAPPTEGADEPHVIAPPVPEVPAPSEDGGDPAVSLRDVWRASRARRKALHAEVRRFTGRARRRRAIWVGVAAALVLLVAATFAAAYSPLLAVERITIVGADRVDVTAVQKALDGQIGRPMPLVDESAVKEALVAFPLIESYSLEARPPHELVLQLVERTPVGVVSSAAGYTVVDAAGVALSTTARKPSGQPLITVEGGTQTSAFRAVGLVMRSLPTAIRAAVTGARATTPDDVTLILGESGAQIVWGSAEESAMKALVLETTMKQKPPRSGRVYDVSSPQAIVVR